jgi:hypothetical protein
VNAFLAAWSVAMCWWLLGRVGVRRTSDRGWLTALFGFSTQILWVTTRAGSGIRSVDRHDPDVRLLIELFGRRRAWLIGLLAGAAFLTRAPLAFAVPVYAIWLAWALDRRARTTSARRGRADDEDAAAAADVPPARG